MENLLELSASGLCSFSLAEAKQKSVCVCEMQDSKMYLNWGKSWVLQRKWHQPLEYGCDSRSCCCRGCWGGIVPPLPLKPLIRNCWSSKILIEWSKHAWIAKQWFFSHHLSLWDVEFPIPHLSHAEISRIPRLEYQWWCENTWEWEPRARCSCSSFPFQNPPLHGQNPLIFLASFCCAFLATANSLMINP